MMRMKFTTWTYSVNVLSLVVIMVASQNNKNINHNPSNRNSTLSGSKSSGGNIQSRSSNNRRMGNSPSQGWGNNPQNGPNSQWNNGQNQNKRSGNGNNQNSNGPPPNWYGPPPNWNNSPNQNNGPNQYNGPPPNWRNGPYSNGPNNMNNGGNRNLQPGNWGQGPYGPSYNWYNNGPLPNGPQNWNYGPNWNGPMTGYGPNPAFMSHHMGQTPPGLGLALMDPDLPDGLDDRFQAMQAHHAMKQMGVNMPPVMLPPLPNIGQGLQSKTRQSPGQGPKPGRVDKKINVSTENSTGQRIGWPIRPSSRAGFWNSKSSQNETGINATSVLPTRVPPTPRLAEYQHNQPIEQTRAHQTNQQNRYPYLYQSGIYGPPGNQYWPTPKPDVPDHLEDRGQISSKSSIKSPNRPAYMKTDPYDPNSPVHTNTGSAHRQQVTGIPRQRLTGLAKSNTRHSGRASLGSQPPERLEFIDPRSSNAKRIQSLYPSNRYQGRLHSSKRRPNITEAVREGELKRDRDYETETEIDKEEGARSVDPKIVRRVLDVIRAQGERKGLDMGSIMDGLNNQGYKYKMKYRYEGNVPPPTWVDRISNIQPETTTTQQKTGNVTSVSLSEVMVQPTQNTTKRTDPRFAGNFNFRQRSDQIHSFPTFDSAINKQQRPTPTNGFVPSPWSPHARQSVIGLSAGHSRQTTTPSITDYEFRLEKGPDGPILNIEHDPVQVTLSDSTPQQITRKPNTLNLSNKVNVTMKSFRASPSNQRTLNVSANPLFPNNTSKLQGKEPVPVPSISASQTFGIIIGVIIGFLVIFAPIICILLRYRKKRKQKQRRVSTKHENRDDRRAMEAMIMDDLGGITRPKSKLAGSNARSIEIEPENSELQELKSNTEPTNVTIHC